MKARTYKWKNNSLLRNELATGRITVIITRYKGAESHGLPGNQENKIAEKPIPKNVGLHKRPRGPGDKDKLVEQPLLLTMWWREKKGEKKPHSIWNSVIIKVPLPPDNNQWGTTTKQKETWTPKPIKCCWSICSTSPNRVSLPAAAAAPSALAAGTGQQLELVEGLGLLLSRWQADGWGNLHSVPSRFNWALLVG